MTTATDPPYPGDEVVPDAVMVYDRIRTVKAPAESVWPWVVQLGKGRGGWYLTRRWERLLPAGWRASRAVEPQWQGLAAGDRVADYGASRDDYFDVVAVDRPRALVYKSERYGAVFTWALLLREEQQQQQPPSGQGGDDGEVETVVHLRFRGRIQSTGLKRKLIVTVGDWFDHWTATPMLAGLAERAEKPHVK